MMRLACLLLLLSLLGCGSSQRRGAAEPGEESAPQVLEGARGQDDRGRCDRAGGISQETDTNRDGVHDVRRTYAKIGDEEAHRMVLVCREVDLNHDGRKDVIRYYTDEGRPLREEADRDFDGRFDQVSFFEEAKVVRRELDSSGNGRVDTWIYLDDGRPARAERDMDGDGRKDYWEYYVEGRVQRIGIDTDGDGVVDHWDRNAALAPSDEEEAGPGASDEGSGGEGEEEAAESSS